MESPYERLGGEQAVRDLVVRFYGFMDELPEAREIRAMHADDLDPMIDRLGTFLIGWMGGPQRYAERFGRVIIPAAHEPYPIGSAESEAWLLCMQRALESVDADEDLIELLMPAFGRMALMCQTRD